MIYTNRNAYLNCEKRIFSGCGAYDIPEMSPVDVEINDCEIIGFNYALGCKDPENKIIHFHLDDHEFERIWNNPNKYIPLLQKFRAVLAPDFSTYEDFPTAVKIFQTYRKMWMAAYWQEHGITVIPTLDWDTNPKHRWYFSGIPRNSLVSVSTVGGFSSKAQAKLYLEGFDRTMKILQPSKLLVFVSGKLPPQIQTRLNESTYMDFIVMGNKNLIRKNQLAKSIDSTGRIVKYDERKYRIKWF